MWRFAIFAFAWSVAHSGIGMIPIGQPIDERVFAVEPDCMTVGAENFDKFMEDSMYTMVWFYADYCQFCHQMAPEWGIVCKTFKAASTDENANRMKVVMVNGMKNRELARVHGVTSFPDIRIFRADPNEPKLSPEKRYQYYYHSSVRKAQNLIKWAQHILNSVITLNTEEDLTELRDAHHDAVVVILYIPATFKDGNPSAAEAIDKALREASFSNEDAFFARVTKPELLATLILPWKERKDVDPTYADGIQQRNQPLIFLHNPFHFDEKSYGFAKRTSHINWENYVWLFPDEIELIFEHTAAKPSIRQYDDNERLQVLKDAAKIEKAAVAFRFPTVTLFDVDTATSLMAANAPILFAIAPDDKLQEYMPELWHLGDEFRGRFIVALVDLDMVESMLAGERLISLLSFDRDEVPLLVLLEVEIVGRTKFKARNVYKPHFDFFGLRHLDEGADVYDDVNKHEDRAFFAAKKYLLMWERGQIQPYMKSEPMPEPPELGEPETIVGYNFKQEVLEDSEHDFFLDFYAPWCGHCRQFEPHMKKLARLAQQTKTLRVGKIDATRNVIKDFPVHAFPTLMLFPAADKRSPRMYNGARAPEQILKWIAENAYFKFDPAVVITNHERSRQGVEGMSEADRIRAVLDEL